MWREMLRSAGCVVLLAACSEHLATKPMATEPEPDYRLSKEQLASLRPGVDPQALERIRARIPEERRGDFLRYFRTGVHAGIVGTDDADLQPLLSAVWHDRTRRLAVDSSDPTPADLSRGVTLALAPRLDDPTAGALIVRDPDAPHDVIVLSAEHATAPQLFRAVGMLMEARLTQGVPTAPTRIVVEAVQVPKDIRGADEVERVAASLYGRYLERLLRSPSESLPGFGRVRSLQVSSFGERAQP